MDATPRRNSAKGPIGEAPVIDTMRPVLAALIDSRRAWISHSEIVASTSLDPDAVDAAVQQFVELGYFDIWDRKPVPVLTLSAWGAATLGYRLSDNGAENVYRWVRGPLDGDAPRRPKRRPRGNEPPPIEEVPDQQPRPPELVEVAEEEELAAAERIEKRMRKGLPLRPEDVPQPTIILMGHSGFPWRETDDGDVPSGFCPECNRNERMNKHRRATCKCRRRHAAEAKQGPCQCPGCRGAKLRRSTYCARDRRWGWDSYFRLGEYARRKPA